jgi:hypothetical protein
MPERHENQQGFEEQKQAFFIKLGLRAREWLQVHREFGGLWEGPKYITYKDGQKKEQRWENVSKHCLVEAARAEAFSRFIETCFGNKTTTLRGGDSA